MVAGPTGRQESVDELSGDTVIGAAPQVDEWKQVPKEFAG